jgi:hypothetical protein
LSWFKGAIAGPVIAEGRLKGYWHVVPLFVGGLIGYYGAAIFSTWLIAWRASLHKQFRKHLFLAANLLLVVLGISYLFHACFGH